MINSFAIKLSLNTLMSLLIVENALPNDLERVMESRDKWEALKTRHHGDYQYTVKWEGFSPTGQETTITVRDNQVVGRSYRTFASWEHAKDDVIKQVWAEVGNELGSHKEGAPAKTLDTLYQEAIQVASRKLEDYEKRFVAFDDQGLLLKCCVDDERIADDGCHGVQVSSIQFETADSGTRETELQLNIEDNGKTFEVPLDGTISVQLDSNRTTGFRWNNTTKAKEFRLQGEVQYEANNSRIGSGGIATATFQPLQAGKGMLTLEYKRPFETKPAAKTFQVTINVQKKDTFGDHPKTYQSPNGKAYPRHWGAPPEMQTRDLRPLPGGYGQGSGTLAKWIQANLDNEVQLTAKDNQKTFKVPVGSVISVQLESNRTTGFRWINATNSDKIQLMGEIAYASEGALAGSGGQATANFRALKPGESVLILKYLRTFEDKPASKTFQVKIEVQEMTDSEKSETTYRSPNGKKFPVHWGSPPKMQTRDLRPLPGGYGQGSGTLAKWIQANLDRDAKHKQQEK